MPILTRLWQMLLKGVSEVKLAPSPLAALEMLLVRIAYAAQMPTPAEVIKNLETEKKTLELGGQRTEVRIQGSEREKNEYRVPSTEYDSFPKIVELFNQNRELLLCDQLKNYVRLVSFEVRKIELKLAPELARDFAGKIGDFLSKWTGSPWKIIVSNEQGEKTLAEQEKEQKEIAMKEISTHPLIASALGQFSGAKLVGVS
jgi:DNA polymerase-3 subunit gamma/tau